MALNKAKIAAKAFIKKSSNYNIFVYVSLIIGIASIVMFFFPFFNYTSTSSNGISYDYSAWDMTCAIVMKDNYASEEDVDFERKSALSEWVSNEQTKEFVQGVTFASLVGAVLMIISFILLFRPGKKAEIATSILALIAFCCCFVFANHLVVALEDAVGLVSIYPNSEFHLRYGLFVSILLADLFMITNFIRKDKIKLKVN